jgi:uncharacterized protein YkwD
MQKFLYLILGCCFTATLFAQPQLTPAQQETLYAGARATPVFKPVTKKNNRNSIVMDYNAEYTAPLTMKQVNWTGTTATCSAGTISSSATNAALKRLNYFRKLLNLKTLPFFVDSLNLKCQQAALVFKANAMLSHTPPSTWTCYNATAYNAASNSNIALNYTPDARFFIDQFFEDAGSSNTAVGHRRWLMNTQAKNYGFGAVIDSSKLCSNALWVLPLSLSWNAPLVNDTIPEYVAYPAGGYFPKKQIVSVYNQYPYRWSFSMWQANFDSTKVEMFNEQGVALNFVTNKPANGYAENTIVWEPTNIDISSIPDVVYKVKLSKVKVNGVNKNYEYDVVLIDNKIYKPEITTVAPSCGNTNGSASVKYTPGYKSIKWSTGGTTENIANLADGKYFVSITDKYGFEVKDSVEVKSKSLPLAITLTATDATCGKNNGSITASTNGTVQSYAWSNALNVQNIKDLAVGKFTLTVTSVDGCISTKDIEIKAKTVGVASVISKNTTCSKNDGTAEAILTGGAAAKAYLWSNAAKTQKITNLAGADYTVTITDENNCETIAKNTVIALTNPNLSITKTDATCGKNNASVTASSPDDVKLVWESGEKTPSLSNLKAGTYTVTATNNDGCFATKFTTINALPIVILKTISKNTSCDANDGTAEVSGVNTVLIKSLIWSNQATTNKITGLAGGNYMLTVTDENKCEVTDKVSIKGLESPKVNLGNDVTLKKGEVATFDAGPGAGYTYKWSNGATTQVIKTNLAATYSVTVTTPEGCSTVGEVKVKFSVNTDDNVLMSNILLTPNPAQDFITLKVDNIATTRAYIINVLGKVVLEDDAYYDANQERKIEISGLCKGTYFLIIQGKNFKQSKPFTKL